MPVVTFNNLTGEDRALHLVRTRYIVSEKALTRTHADYDKWFRMYRGERVNANYQGLSNITVPKVFEKVERGTALLSQAIKKVRVIGQGNPQQPQQVQQQGVPQIQGQQQDLAQGTPNKDKENAEFNEKLIEYEDRVLGIRRIIKQWIKSSRIHGEAFIKVTWNIGLEDKKRPYKGIQISIPDPKTIFYNPDHTSDQASFRWVIHRIDIPFNDLMKDKSIDKVILEKIRNTSMQGKTALPEDIPGRRRETHQDTKDTTELTVKIKEYHGPFAEKDGDLEVPYIITVANDKVLLKMEKSIYAEILDDPIPIFPLYTYITPHQAHSMGDAEAIESLYTELNDTRNQRMDTVTLNIDPMKIILKAAQIDEKDLVAKRGWYVHSNLPNGVTVVPPDMQGVVASINEERIIQGDIDRTLGIPSFGAETPVSGDVTTDTATGVNAVLSAQDIISNSLLEEVKSALQKVYRTILAYNQKFIDRKFKITLLEENDPAEIEISPDRIKGNMDLDVEVELVGNRISRRLEALAALKVGGSIPGSNMAKLWEDYLRTHDKYDFEDYFTPPEPPPAPAPKLSVALRGEIGAIQANQLYTTIQGANPKFGDPAFTKEGRQIMKGKLPEDIEENKIESEITKNLATAANQRQNAELPQTKATKGK